MEYSVNIKKERNSDYKSGKMEPAVFPVFIIPTISESKPEIIIPQPQPQVFDDFHIRIMKRSMNDYELDMLEERTAIMEYNEVENYQEEAVKDIISLRDRTGLAGAIVNLFGGIELMNPEIQLAGK